MTRPEKTTSIALVLHMLAGCFILYALCATLKPGIPLWRWIVPEMCGPTPGEALKVLLAFFAGILVAQAVALTSIRTTPRQDTDRP